MHVSSLAAAVALLATQANGITVYSQIPLAHATETATAGTANYTGSAAYDPTMLTPPPPPTNMTKAFTLELQGQASAVQGLSIPQKGTFLGFSIEMSVINQVLGKNSSVIQVPFLNLMSNLVARAGSVNIRIGGNTQETAHLVESTPDGRMLEKDYSGINNPTQTPPLVYTPDVFYLLANISSLVNVNWYLGIPFFDTVNWRLEIIEYGDRILGDRVLGYQAGNEPDLYQRHGHRAEGYGPYNYFGEFADLLTALDTDTLRHARTKLLGPSVATADWTPEQVWDTGFVDAYKDNLMAITVEHYPTDNCFAQFGVGSFKDPQETFASFLTHSAAVELVRPYYFSSGVAQAAGKPFIMFETNTASCGGFPGISDSYGSALWALDYGMQMAHANFTGAQFHVGGQSVYYNPFTAPPTNQSTFRQWTVGPIFYSVMIMGEAFGQTGTARIIDLQANGGDIHSPAYVIYENDKPSKVALFNFATDNSTANDLTVTLRWPGVPNEVRVKRLEASSVAQKENITWAGQTFGNKLESDGILRGDLNIETVSCNTAGGFCDIKVPAPGFALVFLTPEGLKSAATATGDIQTHPTTAQTRTAHTATVDPSVLATSNGMNGVNRVVGSTSKGSTGAAGRTIFAPTLVALLAVSAGAWLIGTVAQA